MNTFRISALLLSAILTGCGKKNDSKDGGDPSATYTIKIPNKKAGDKYEITMTEESDDLKFGAAEPTTTKKTAKSVYTEVVEMMGSARSLSKGKHIYSTAEETKDGKTTNLGFANKTILIEQNLDKKYTFKFEGGAELTGLDSIKMTMAFKNSEEDKVGILLPEKAVKVGETWTVDPNKLVAEMEKEFKGGKGGPKLDATQVSASGKLTKAYKKDGAQFGIIELNLKIPSAFGDMEMTMTIDGCIDGTAMDHTLEQNMKISAEFMPGKKIDMNQKRTMILKTVK